MHPAVCSPKLTPTRLTPQFSPITNLSSSLRSSPLIPPSSQRFVSNGSAASKSTNGQSNNGSSHHSEHHGSARPTPMKLPPSVIAASPPTATDSSYISITGNDTYFQHARKRSGSISSISTEVIDTLQNLDITRRYGSATPFTIGCFIVKLCTGAGILGLPYSYDNAGILTCIIMTIVLVIFGILSCRILLRSREIMLVAKQHFLVSETLYTDTDGESDGEGLMNSKAAAQTNGEASKLNGQATNGNYGSTNGSPHAMKKSYSQTQLQLAKQAATDAVTLQTQRDGEAKMAHDSYGELAAFTMGAWGPLVVDTSLILSFLGAVALYIITITQLLHEVFPNIPPIYFTLFSTVFLLPFALTRDLSWLNSATILATIAYGVGFIVIFWYGFDLHRAQEQDPEKYHELLYHIRGINWISSGSVGSIMTAFGVLAFSLDVPTMVFIFEEEMAEPVKFNKTLNWSMAVIATTFIAIGTFGVLLFHNTEQGVQQIVLSNLPAGSLVSHSVKVAVAVTLLLSSPLSLSPALNLIEHAISKQHTAACHEPHPSAEHDTLTDQSGEPNESDDDAEDDDALNDAVSYQHSTSNTPRSRAGNSHSNDHTHGDHSHNDHSTHSHQHTHHESAESWYRSNTAINILRVLIHLLVVYIAFSMPYFTLVMSLLGCVTFALLCYILPPAMYLLLHRHDHTQLHRHYQRINSQDIGEDVVKQDWSLKTYAVLNWIYLVVGIGLSAASTFVVIRDSKTQMQ